MKWIKVEDKLPKKYQDVLVYDNVGIAIGYIDYQGKWFIYGLLIRQM